MAATTLGFIGLGVMGEPMCRNLAAKSGATVLAHDLDSAPLERLASHGVIATASAGMLMRQCDVVFLSLPSGEVVARLAHAEDGLLAQATPGKLVVDLSTSPVSLTRQLAQEFADRGALFIDAPVARTRAAAEAGTLSITVGASDEAFTRVKPLLATFASDITHCGSVGCGQVVKILNNMVLFQTVAALSEAKAIGTRAGVNASALFEALSKGSADSFALRNHGLKAMVPGEFPARAFPVNYALKDLSYALDLARELAVDARGAQNVARLFEQAIAAGESERYWPVICKLFEAP